MFCVAGLLVCTFPLVSDGLMVFHCGLSGGPGFHLTGRPVLNGSGKRERIENLEYGMQL